jgi:hypothetical protein
MKEYMKPTLELIELRPEERLARCKLKFITPSLLGIIFGKCCYVGWKGNCACS